MNPDFTNIFIDGVLMQVHVSFWSGAKILRPEDLGLKPEQIAAAYKLGRKMLIPAEIIRAFRRIEGQARRLVEENSFSFPIGNASFVTRRSFTKVNKRLEELKAEYMNLVENLIAKYEQYRQEILPVYQDAAETAFLTSQPSMIEGSLEGFDASKKEFIQKFLDRIASYYPAVDSLRKRFSLDWDVYEIAAPQARETDATSVMESEEERTRVVAEARAQMAVKVNGFVTDVVKVLRQEAVDVCSKIVTAIKEGKVVRSTTVSSLKGFIEKFRDMNFVGDQTIEAQLNAVHAELLDGRPENVFVEDMDLREELGRRLAVVVEEAGKLTDSDLNNVTGGYNRKVAWR
jgi:F0F1-type ATP synthase membrane subunit b/b'